MTEIFATVVLAACVAMLARLLIGERRRERVDRLLRRGVQACRRFFASISRRRSSKRDAAKVAEEAIKRAREGTERDGNVYKPKSFRGPRKPH